MPSFFESIKRIVQGEPVFDASEQPDDDRERQQDRESDDGPREMTTPAPAKIQPSIRKGDASTFPVVYVRRTDTRLNGITMQVQGFIINTSASEIMLDKIRFLDKTVELDTFLRPGEERQFTLYSGPTLQRERYPEAELEYKTPDGDYFETFHEIRFKAFPDKTYGVDELRYRGPVHDIYG